MKAQMALWLANRLVYPDDDDGVSAGGGMAMQEVSAAVRLKTLCLAIELNRHGGVAFKRALRTTAPTAETVADQVEDNSKDGPTPRPPPALYERARALATISDVGATAGGGRMVSSAKVVDRKAAVAVRAAARRAACLLGDYTVGDDHVWYACEDAISGGAYDVGQGQQQECVGLEQLLLNLTTDDETPNNQQRTAVPTILHRIGHGVAQPQSLRESQGEVACAYSLCSSSLRA